MSQASLSLPNSAAAPAAARWRGWPLRAHPVVGAMLIWALAAAVVGIYEGTGQPHLAALAGLALVISLWRFFLPVIYELNGEGVHQWILGRHRLLDWSCVARYEIRADGVLLLPCADACPLDVVRGLYVPWGNHRDEVLANLGFYLARLTPA